MSLAALKDREVAVLLGGTAAEREVSLKSGATVAQGLRDAGFRVREIDPAADDWVRELEHVGFVFNVLHGPGGEDGTVQGLLESLGLAYSGSGVLGSALAMDKLRSKQLWRGAGIATADFAVLTADCDWAGTLASLGGAAFVKPVCEGSSLGMSIADSPDALQQGFELAREFGAQVLAEARLPGPEYTVAILGDEALPPIRLETPNAFYDYDAKYQSEETRYHIPCGLNADTESQLRELALSAFSALGCAVWGRVDVMRDADGELQVLEVNTVPGMTSHSLVPMAAKASGLEMPALLERIIELSLAGRSA